MGIRSDGDGQSTSFYPPGGIRTRPDLNQGGYMREYFSHPHVTRRVPEIKCVSVLRLAGQPIYLHSHESSLGRRDIFERL
jgi:hypothetical protein